MEPGQGLGLRAGVGAGAWRCRPGRGRGRGAGPAGPLPPPRRSGPRALPSDSAPPVAATPAAPGTLRRPLCRPPSSSSSPSSRGLRGPGRGAAGPCAGLAPAELPPGRAWCQRRSPGPASSCGGAGRPRALVLVPAGVQYRTAGAALLPVSAFPARGSSPAWSRCVGSCPMRWERLGERN